MVQVNSVEESRAERIIDDVNALFDDLTCLTAETYLLQALNTRGLRTPLMADPGHVPDGAYITRWPESAFALRVYMGPDYGVLFTPHELKHYTQLVRQCLQGIAAADPERLRFVTVNHMQQADMIIRFRKVPAPAENLVTLDVTDDKRIRRADVVWNIPRTCVANQVALGISRSLLKALGVMGDSDDPADTGAAWSPLQQMMTRRDCRTLQLLYRCPPGLTRQDLNALWEEYLAQTRPVSERVEVVLIGDVPDETLRSVMGKPVIPSRAELSGARLSQIKTA